MSEENPFRDDEFRPPAPSEAEENQNPLPLSDALCEKKEEAPAPSKKLPKKKKNKKNNNYKYSQSRMRPNVIPLPEPEEHREFYRQWDISDGFDVDFCPPGLCCCCGGAADIFKDMVNLNESDRREACYVVKLAIKYHNEREELKLDFVELVKFNLQYLDGTMYYITFKAKDGDGFVSVYQAKVCYEDIEDGETKVLMIRKKPSMYREIEGPVAVD